VQRATVAYVWDVAGCITDEILLSLRARMSAVHDSLVQHRWSLPRQIWRWPLLVL